MPRHSHRAVKRPAAGTASSFVLQLPVNLRLPLTQLARAPGTAGIHSGCANIKISEIPCVTKAARAPAAGGVRLPGGGPPLPRGQRTGKQTPDAPVASPPLPTSYRTLPQST